MASAGRVLKIVTIGDGAVGKTSMLFAYTQGKFDDKYIPTVFDSYAGDIEVQGRTYNYTLWDTAGQEGFDRCRILSYDGANVFLVCFSVNSTTSYNNVRHTWVPEVRKEVGDRVPLVLIGTKCDLRDPDSDSKKFITRAEGKKLAKSLNMAAYVECSAREMIGLKEVFIEAIIANDPSLKPKPRCVIL